MALVPCRECGKPISTEAPTCPHCGVLEPWRRVPEKQRQASAAREMADRPASAQQPPPEEKRGANRVLLVSAIILATLILGTYAWLFVSNSQSDLTRSGRVLPRSSVPTYSRMLSSPQRSSSAWWLDSASRSRFEAGDYSRAIYYARQIRYHFPDSEQADSAAKRERLARAHQEAAPSQRVAREPGKTRQQASPQLAAMHCATKEAASQIRKTRNALVLLQAGCRLLYPAEVAVLGEENGFVKLRYTKDSSIRWTVRRDQMPAEGHADLSLPEDQKRSIHSDVLMAEDRANREAEQRYPVSCASGPVDDETIQRWADLLEELEERYRAEVLKRRGITAEQWSAIASEALREKWPLPPAPDPCRIQSSEPAAPADSEAKSGTQDDAPTVDPEAPDPAGDDGAAPSVVTLAEYRRLQNGMSGVMFTNDKPTRKSQIGLRRKPFQQSRLCGAGCSHVSSSLGLPELPGFGDDVVHGIEIRLLVDLGEGPR